MKHNSYQFLSANRLSNVHEGGTPVKRKKIRTGKTEQNSSNTLSIRQNNSATEIVVNHRQFD